MATHQDEANELYQSIMETVEILGDVEAVAALRETAQAIERGDAVGRCEVRARLE